MRTKRTETREIVDVTCDDCGRKAFSDYRCPTCLADLCMYCTKDMNANNRLATPEWHCGQCLAIGVPHMLAIAEARNEAERIEEKEMTAWRAAGKAAREAKKGERDAAT